MSNNPFIQGKNPTLPSDQFFVVGGNTIPATAGSTVVGSSVAFSVGSTGVINSQQANTSYLTDTMSVSRYVAATDAGATFLSGTALSNTAVNLKTSAGNLLDGFLYNPSGSTGCTVKFYNAVGSTVSGGVTATFFKVPIGSTFPSNTVALRNIFGDLPLYFSNAISFNATVGYADSDNTGFTNPALVSYHMRVA